MQSVRSEAELGNRIRQAACEMTCPKATRRNLTGAASPVPVAPHPEIRACWFSKVVDTCRRLGRRTRFTFAVNVTGTTSLTNAMSLLLVAAFEAIRNLIW